MNTAILDEFKLSGQSWEEISEICEPERRKWIGASHHMQWKDGIPVIAFGKHGGTPLHELAAGPDASYLAWMMSKDFPEHVKRICKGAIDHRGDELVGWIVAEFGAPLDNSEAS